MPGDSVDRSRRSFWDLAMNASAVADYVAGLAEPTRDVLGRLCAIVAGVDDRIVGSIKWNAPSFAITEHFATTGVAPCGTVRLVLHTGAVKRAQPLKIEVSDPAGLLTWKGLDRAIVIFTDVSEVDTAAAGLKTILASWIRQTQ